MAFSDEQIRLILNLGESKKNVEEVKAALDAMGESVEKVDKKTKTGKSGIGAWTQEIQGAGRALQDFIQGGVGGVLNNIEQILSKFPVLGAAVTGVAAVLYAAWTPLTNWVKAWKDGVNDIPKAAEGLSRLNDELKTNQERIEKLVEKGYLSNAEQGEYNKLLEKQASLEKEIADQKERQSTFEKARQSAAQSGRDEERAAVAQTIINDMMGGVDAARAQVGREMVGQSQASGRLREIRDAQIDADRRRNRLRDAGQDQILVDIGNGQKYAVDREEYFTAVQRKAWAEYKAEVKRLGDEADKVVQGALQGDTGASERMALEFDRGRMRDWLQATAGGQSYSDRWEAEMMASTARTPEQKAAQQRRREQQKKDAKDQQEFEAGALRYTMEQRRLRDQAQAMDDQAEMEAYQSTVDRNQRAASGTREQQQAMNQAREAALLQKDATEGGQIAGIAQREFGANLSQDQTAAALQEARNLVNQGWAPNIAARQAISGVVNDLIGSLQQAAMQSQFQAGEIAGMRMQLQQLRQMQQVAPSILNMGRQ